MTFCRVPVSNNIPFADGAGDATYAMLSPDGVTAFPWVVFGPKLSVMELEAMLC